MNWKLYSILLVLASFFSDASYQAYVRPLASFFKVELPELRYSKQEKIAEIKCCEHEISALFSSAFNDSDYKFLESIHENNILNRLTFYYTSRLRA